MASPSEAQRARKAPHTPDVELVVRAIFIVAGLLTAAWLLGLVLIARWVIVSIF